MADQPMLFELAEFCAGSRYSQLPAPVQAAAPTRVLDVLGLCLAALPLPSSLAVAGHVRDSGGRAQSSAVGIPERLPAASAALINGVLAHSLDYDDTHLPSILHPSAPVVPAALAATEAAGADGPTLLAAVVVGIEVCVRLGMAGYDRDAGTSVFFERGQHATSICGTLAAAAAASRAFCLPAEQLGHAISIAASMGSGVIEANRTGGTVKRIHCGWAAQAGVQAAQLARRGITGPPTVLEGRFGFFQAWLSGRFEPAELVAGLGERWAVTDLHDKPYPANHFTHAIADGAIALRSAGLRPEEVAAVRIGVPTPVVRTVGDPIAAKRRPESGYHAKFSAPYVFVAALFGGGGLGLAHEDFEDELVRDPTRQALMDLVEVVADPDCDRHYPAALPAIVTVRTHDGRLLTRSIMDNRGGPMRPLSTEERLRKFTDNAARAIRPEIAQLLAEQVAALPAASSLDSLTQPLREGPQ